VRTHNSNILLSSIILFSVCSASAQDRAVYEVFSRYAPSVYSISVEIPKHVILKRLSESFQNLDAPNLIKNSTNATNLNLYNYVMNQYEQHFNTIREQMLSNNRVRGVGFAIDQQHMVTLSTVVQSATYGGEITLENEERSMKAKVKGVDQMTGVALLEVLDASFEYYVDVSSHPSFRHQEVSLPIGSFVMTIQRPYDLPASPFSGIIGGYYRTMKIFEIERYIQTDLPLYPGNEGSPIFSPSGQFIGMIATRYSVENWPSLTFAIPADIIYDSAKSLKENGKSERGWIPGLSVTLHNGRLVIDLVKSESPAADAGLQKGEQIIGFEGRSDDVNYSNTTRQ